MLVIDVVTAESYDETTGKFVKSESVRLELEHSLVSLSKWEEIWEKPFLSTAERTDEETISYIKAMIVGPEPSPEVFYHLLTEHLEEIKEYVSAKKSGTHLPAQKDNGRRETVTAEMIYYWMSKLGVSMECQHWHLNRLFSYLRLCAFKESPQRKMTMEERRALNKQRQREWNTRG